MCSNNLARVAFTSTPVKEDGPLPQWSVSTPAGVNVLDFLQEDDSIPIQGYEDGRAPISHPKKGLPNLGNTCYINCILQLLLGSQTFHRYIMGHKYCEAVMNDAMSCVTCVLRKMENELKVSFNSDAHALICSNITAISPLLECGTQQDACQFFGFLMNKLGEEDYISRFNDKEEVQNARTVWRLSSELTLFGGLWKKTITCTHCNQPSMTVEAFNEIAVPVISEKAVDNLATVFNGSLLEGDDAYYCNNCLSKKTAVETVSITRLPELFGLTLKRFDYRGWKDNHVPVENLHRLDLGAFCEVTEENTCTKYELIGIGEHLGPSVNGGHYTATVKTGPDEYHLFDDAQVTRLLHATLPSKDSVFLLYERRIRRVLVTRLPGDTPMSMQLGKEAFKVTSSLKLSECDRKDLPPKIEQAQPSRKNQIRLDLLRRIESYSKTSVKETSCDGSLKYSSEEGNEATDTEKVNLDSEQSEVDVSMKPRSVKYAAIDYQKHEGKFMVKRDIWDSQWDRQKETFKNQRSWGFILKKHIRVFKPYCKHNFSSSGLVYKTGDGKISVRAYTYCGTGNCKHYAYYWNIPCAKEDVEIDVWSAGTENHPQALTKTTQCKGAERDELRNKLKHKDVYSHKASVVRDLDPLVFRDNNWQNLKSNKVFREIKMEAMAEEDHCKDDFLDVVAKRRAELTSDVELQYIQKVQEPLVVYLYCQLVVKAILNHFSNRHKVYLHIDASGQFVRKSLHDKKNIYLYCGVVNVSGTIIPILQMISSLHDQATISSFFASFRQFCTSELKRKWPVIGRVVTDCSLAIVRGVMLAWNSMSLERYLKVCYSFCHENSCAADDLTYLVLFSLCKNHWMKMASINVSSRGIKGEKKQLIMECVARLMECRSLQEFDNVFHHFLVVLLCPVNHEKVSQSFKALDIAPFGEAFFNEPTVTNIAEELEEHEFVMEQSLQVTPFHKHCLQLKQGVLDLIESLPSDLERNKYYCPVFVNEIVLDNLYAALIPMWTCIMDTVRGAADNNFVRSNANAEGYFNLKKNKVHKDMLRTKPGRFITVDFEHVLVQAKGILLNIRTDGKPFHDTSPEKTYLSTVVDTLPEKEDTSRFGRLNEKSTVLEAWKVTPKKKPQHRDGLTIHSIAQKTALSRGQSAIETKDPCLHYLLDEEIESQEVEEAATVKKGRTYISIDTKNESWNRPLPRTGKPSASSFTLSLKKKRFPFSDSASACLDEIKSLKSTGPNLDVGLNLSSVSSRRDNLSLHLRAQRNSPLMGTSVGSSNKCNQEIMKDLSLDRGKQYGGVEKEELLYVGQVISDASTLPTNHYYRYYTVPKMNIARGFRYASQLSPADLNFIEKTCHGDMDTPVLVYGESDRFLALQNFLELLDDLPLSNSTVDACLHCLELESDGSICILNSTEGKEIFFLDYTISLSVNRHDFKKISKFLVPYLLSGHWVILYGDLKQRCCQLLDPAGGIGPANENDMKLLFEAYLRKRGLLNCSLSLNSSITYPQQSDEVNCGVFILKFTESLIQNRLCVDTFGITDFRVSLAEMCIATAKEILQESEIACTAADLLFQRHDNGLFKNPYYYANRNVVDHDCLVVCNFGLGLQPVCKLEFEHLVLGDWIHNGTLDAAINVYMTYETRERFLNVSFQDTQKALRGEAEQHDRLSNVSISGRTLLMPVCVGGNHWTLIIANMKDKTYCFLDPMNLKFNSKYKSKFILFLSNRNRLGMEQVHTKGWKVVSPNKFPCQNDSSNCGILVILYALLTMKIMKISKNFNAREFRGTIARKLLDGSSTMRHLCLICGVSNMN